MSETFNFGYGPVPAHQHPNGGGWVADTATVADTAYIGPDARVSGNARVYGTARVSGTARVYGTARVSGTARVYDDAWVSGTARVYDDAWVSGTARVYDDAWVYGNARVYDDARVYDRRHVLTLPVLGNESGTLWRTSTGHQLQAGCKVTTISEAREALEHPKRVWPDVGAATRKQFARQWKLALKLCQARVDEWWPAVPVEGNPTT